MSLVKAIHDDMTDYTDYLSRLNEALTKFKAVTVNDITDKYTYHPDYVSSRLGAGSYGEAFRMRAVADNHEPLRVVKVIPKARVSKNALQIQHLAAELAVTGFFSHPNLNKRVGLYHNNTNVYLVLELVEGSRPSARSRLLHLFATTNPPRLADFDAFYASLERDAAAGGFGTVDEYLDQSGRMRTILAECGVKREIPTATDLFGLIVAMKRVPDGLSRILNRQALLALAHLHENNVVHRDVKTENLVLGIDRDCELIYAADGKTIQGVRVREKVQAKLIDFGLVKYMKLGAFPPVISPGMFDPARAAAAATGTGGGLGGRDEDLGFEDDDCAAAGNVWSVGNAFPVAVTPCGTELYCSLDVIDGIIASGIGKTKWMSTSSKLPKMDVYGVGTMMFCCANGRPPFRPPRDQYRPLSREERIKQVQRLVAAGPIFSGNVADATRDYVLYLMENDPDKRPTAQAALNHPFLNSVTSNVYVWEVNISGAVTEISVGATPGPQPAQVTPSRPAEEDDDAAAEDDYEDVVAAALRGKEDAGDDAGKEQDAQ
jgi:serine/threonine protein kinase